MAAPFLKRVRDGARDVPRAFEAIQDAVQALVNGVFAEFPILDGVFLKDVQLKAGVSTAVGHRLGRAALGWIVVRKDKLSIDVADSSSPNPVPDAQLLLVTDAGAETLTVSLWVF